MNFLTRIFKKIKNKSIEIINGASSSLASGLENFYDSFNLRTFKESLYLFIGVSMIRETVSSIPLELYRIKNKNGEVEEIYDDPFLTLLNRPNHLQTYKEFMKLSVSYYLLAGEAFWYLDKELPTSEPMAMANLRPDNVRILLSEDKREIIGYEFIQSNGQTIKLRVDQVLHFKNVDPTNPERGVGVVYPATQRIVTEKEASKHQSETFRTHGRPDVAIMTDIDLNEEQAEDARTKWDKIYGTDKGAKAGFFGESVKDIKLLGGITPKEMDYIESQKFLREDILASLRIPIEMIKSEVNYANSKTARINYVKEACMPVLDVFIDVINNKFLADKFNDTFLTYESPVNEDRELLLKESTELKKAGIITVNEARELMNYDTIDGGDELSPETGLLFGAKTLRLRKIAKALLRNRSILIKKFEAIDAVTKMIVAVDKKEKGVKRYRNSVFNTKELKENYVKAYNNNIDAKSSIFKDTVDVYNNGLQARILKKQEDFGVNANNIFDVNFEMGEAKRIFTPLMKTIFERAGQETLDAVAKGFSTKASEHFYTAEEYLKALEQRAEFFIASMLDTDYNQMKALIIQGLADGKGVDAIGRLIRTYFDDMSVARAKTIARTETGRLVSSATNEAYKQSEVVTGKEWLTANDSKVRDNSGTVDDHVINNGVIVATDGVFPNGEHFPAELTINCRCAIAPAV